MQTPEGKLHRIAPPKDLGELRRDQRAPDPRHGTPKLVVSALAVGVIAAAGRKLLRLRL